MKTRILFVAVLASFLCAASCVKQQDADLPEEHTLTFNAYFADNADGTRTSIQSDGTSVWWSPKESINIFYGDISQGEFVSTNDEPRANVAFSGNLNTYFGTGLSYWAVYPYDESNSCDGESVTLTVPNRQKAKEGSFADGMFPSVATSDNFELAFYNVCGGLQFTVSRSDIISVTFRASDDKVIAGTVKVAFGEDGKPVVTEIIDGKSEVTLKAPEDTKYFKPGVKYFLSMLPADLSAGFTMTFVTYFDKAGSFTSGKENTIRRGIFGVLSDIDTKVTEWEDIEPEPGIDNEAVDLGLSVKWATMNVGANCPEEYGDYFAWGETEPKSDYSGWPTYKWCNGSETSLTRYNTNSDYGTVDNKFSFAGYGYIDDAARANWGGSWRTPSNWEWYELMTNCTWTWQTNYNETGLNGYLVTSNMSGYTDKSIFLPAAGFRAYAGLDYVGSAGLYLSSSLNKNVPDYAWGVYFDPESLGWFPDCERYVGRSVRPVIGTPKDTGDSESVAGVLLNFTELSGYEGSVFRLSAYVYPDNAANWGVSWSSINPSVASVDNTGKVTANAPGQATITVTTIDGGFTAECVVTVTKSTWALVGVNGDWDNDIEMLLTDDGKWVSPATKIAFEFKIRSNHSWSLNRGGVMTALGEPFEVVQDGPNIQVDEGTYIVTYDPAAETIVVAVWVETDYKE